MDVLRGLGWTQSRVDPNLWYRDTGDHYELMGVWMDNLLIASRNPKAIIKELEVLDHLPTTWEETSSTMMTVF